MQRAVGSSFRGGSWGQNNQHVIDMEAQNTFALYNRKGIWRHFRSSRGYFTIHFIPLVLIFSVFVLWWFSYPVNLEFVDGRLIAARKMELEPELVNQSRVDYTILMKKEVTLPPKPLVPQNTTLMNETSSNPTNPTLMNVTSSVLPNPTLLNVTSSVPPNQTLMNVTSLVPPNPTLVNLTSLVPPKLILMNDTSEDSEVSSE